MNQKLAIKIYDALKATPGWRRKVIISVIEKVLDENSGVVNDEKDLTRLLDHMEANEGILDDLPADIEKI